MVLPYVPTEYRTKNGVEKTQMTLQYIREELLIPLIWKEQVNILRVLCFDYEEDLYSIRK